MRSGAPMMLRDISAAADLIPAQTHAYLTSFRRVELVEQDAGTGRYLLGPAATRLAVARIRGSNVLSAASQAVVRLSEELGVMAAIVVWGPDSPTAIQVQEGAQSLNINIRAGTAFSVTGSASGRIFGAFSRDENVANRIRSEFSGAAQKAVGLASSTEEFMADLANIRAAGYSRLFDSPVPGLCSVSAPVTSASGDLLLALTLVGRVEGPDQGSASQCVTRLLETTRSLSGRAPAETAA